MVWETSEPIVVPVDFSGMSVTAIATALRLAQDRNQIHVLHVVPVLDQIAPDMEHLAIPSDADRQASVRQHFSEFLSKHGFPGLRQVVLDGQPGVQIAEYAKGTDCNSLTWLWWRQTPTAWFRCRKCCPSVRMSGSGIAQTRCRIAWSQRLFLRSS